MDHIKLLYKNANWDNLRNELKEDSPKLTGNSNDMDLKFEK